MGKNELTHWGIKGMKWGVRRSEAQLARIRGKSEKENWSEDHANAATLRTKSVSQMSNAELRKLNERMQLEQNYSNLMRNQKSAGRKFVESVLSETAKELAKDYTKKGVKAGVRYVSSKVTNAVGLKELNDFGRLD